MKRKLLIAQVWLLPFAISGAFWISPWLGCPALLSFGFQWCKVFVDLDEEFL